VTRAADAKIRAAFADVLPQVYAYGLMLGGDRGLAQDLAQATCLRSLEKAGELGPRQSVDVWLFAQAYRIWTGEMQAMRGREINQASFGLEWLTGLPDPQDSAIYFSHAVGLDQAQVSKIVMRSSAKVTQWANRIETADIEHLKSEHAAAVGEMPALTIPPASFADLKRRHKQFMARLAAAIAVGGVAIYWASGGFG